MHCAISVHELLFLLSIANFPVNCWFSNNMQFLPIRMGPIYPSFLLMILDPVYQLSIRGAQHNDPCYADFFFFFFGNKIVFANLQNLRITTQTWLAWFSWLVSSAKCFSLYWWLSARLQYLQCISNRDSRLSLSHRSGICGSFHCR